MGKLGKRKRERARGANEPSATPSNGGSSLTISPEELSVAVEVIQKIADNVEALAEPQFRQLRRVLHPLVVEQMTKYNDEEERDKARESYASNRAVKRRKLNLESKDKMFINNTQLRAARMKHLEALNEEGKEEVLRVLDGVANEHEQASILLLQNVNSDQLQLPAADSMQQDPPTKSGEDGERLLLTPIKCYTCKKYFVKLHFFYDQLCPECADLNYLKRNEITNMRDKVCLVTGARVKIGFRCALKLLRCGAHVIATTRFPHDATTRFAKEPDFAVWKDHLHLYGLDFRNVGALEDFCAFIKSKWNRLDVIINNACQTIRRPPVYYQHLLDNESKFKQLSDVPEPLQPLVRQHFHSTQPASIMNSTIEVVEDVVITEDDESEPTPSTSSHSTPTTTKHTRSTPLQPVSTFTSKVTMSSAEMTQIKLLPEDHVTEETKQLFPTGATDVNQQQVDLRKQNSWMLKLDQVSTPELAEVMVINAIAPTVINAKLKPLMMFDKETPKFIVNVSAMEGKFYRYKSETHPHTNMAKAALNMMTRTSAQDYLKSNIYMTAVDTGWINDEKPIELAVNHMQTHNFQTPLDEIDAAARVLDPVIAPLKNLAEGKPLDAPWGIFLKDFAKCEW